MPNINKFKSAGFSLVELMVVIAIIVILSSIGMAVYFQAEIKSRDNQRISDLKQVQAALEQYHNDLGYYPQSLLFDSGGQIFASLPPNPITQESVINVYLNILPRDPKYYSGSSHKNYMYLSKPNTLLGDASNCDNGPTKCYDYCLYAQVEIPPGSNNSSCFTDAFKTAYPQPSYNYNLRNRNEN